MNIPDFSRIKTEILNVGHWWIAFPKQLRIAGPQASISSAYDWRSTARPVKSMQMLQATWGSPIAPQNYKMRLGYCKISF